MNPAESRGIPNDFSVEPAEEKAQLATLVAVPFVEVCAEDRGEWPACVEIVHEEELPLVVRVATVEKKGSEHGQEKEHKRPGKAFAFPRPVGGAGRDRFHVWVIRFWM